jgi:galacturan 1,4-alpha-galacturonidase
MMFLFMNDTIVKSIHSINPKFFHIGMSECHKFRAEELTLEAPGNSPNTDGMHIERSSDVRVSYADIKTGDDCISIGHGNTNMYFSNIKCGPGHGISVGSLGRYAEEQDVNGLIVRDSYITGTMNGVRIKTWRDSPCKITATNMTFENIIMTNVSNPIIIDQNYCPYSNCASQVPNSTFYLSICFSGCSGACQNAKLSKINIPWI